MKKAMCLANNRGSALASVFIVVTVLIMLGMGIYALSLANTKQAKTTDTFEKDYYVADGGARQAQEALKSAALEQYRLIAADLKNGVQSSNNATSFFAALDAVAYAPAAPDSSAGGPTSNAVTISHATVNSTTHRYTVSSTATDGKTPRTVKGTIDISFVPVQAGFMSFGSQAMISGATITSQMSAAIVQGDTIAKNYTIDYPTSLVVNGTKTTGTVAPVLNTDYNDNYEAKTSATLSIPAVANGATVSSSSFSAPPNNWTIPSPLYVDGVSNASYTVSGISVTGGGQIYSYKDLSVTNGTYQGTSGSWLKLYSSGNMTISSCTLQNVKIFCGGTLTITSCGVPSNIVIDCAGSVTISGTSLSNTKLYSGNDLNFSGNSIAGNSIICVADDFSFTNASGAMNGLFYAGGDITINQASMILDGQIVAAGNISINQASPIYTYDAALIANLEKDPFITGGAGSSILSPPDSQIFTNASALSEQ